MTKEEFIAELADDMEIEVEVTSETSFQELDEWDSMGMMVLIGSVLEKFEVTLTAEDITKLTTFESLIERIGVEKFS
ncbi:acyl carrier protein [Allomuricauda sp. R78024]|uniref:acyl carrier protein n=1 Tax=Allomuricauda sp. R78024 TaxID=3093867 RepID=UPI0037CAF61D